MSISILNTRFFGNLDKSLKYHVNGGYLRRYTHPHKWSGKVWDMSDMTAFRKNFKAISLKYQPAHVKFIHNQQPLEDQQHQQSPVKDANLKISAQHASHERKTSIISALPPEPKQSKKHKNHAQHHPEGQPTKQISFCFMHWAACSMPWATKLMYYPATLQSPQWHSTDGNWGTNANWLVSTPSCVKI